MSTAAVRRCHQCGTPLSEGKFCGACMLEAGLDGAADELDAPRLSRFGDYELLEELGRGGQGVVYRARQVSLNRIVALKVIGLGQWATPAHFKRFHLEAEAAAGLDHPNIVPIYEVGERDGSCFFSMKIVQGGGPLDQVASGAPFSAREAAELVAKLARTVHYAHQRGILHRDIKPGNILVDAGGEPHLTDFGLARLLEKESTITRTLEVFGTPSYMAPEQAAGENNQLTTGTDIYGLGAVLYYLLTGAPPFAGGSTYETIRLVLQTEPKRPSLVRSGISRDFETICLKCLEKQPARRYRSADALANELERFLDGEPILSRHISSVERAWRWCRRKPVIAGLTSALLIALVAGGIGVMWQLYRVRAQQAIAERNLYCADTNLAYQAWQEGNLQRAQELLRAHLPKRGHEDLRGFEWRYLWQLCRDESRATFSNVNFTSRPVEPTMDRHLALLGDGHTLVVASGSRLRWLDTQTQREVRTLSTSALVRAVATAKDRPELLAYYADKIYCIGAGGESLLAGGVPLDSCGVIALSADGTLLAATGLNRFSPVPVRLWDVKSGRQLAEYFTKAIGANSLAFSPDNKYLLCGGGQDTRIEVFALPGMQPLQRVDAHGGYVTALGFNRDGSQVASASNDGQIILWRFPEMREITRLLGHHGAINDVTFAPDEHLLVSGGGDQTIRVWSLNRPGVHSILRGHLRGVKSLVFSPKGDLYSASLDDTIKVWSAGSSQSRDVLLQPSFLYSLVFSPDGRSLAAADYFASSAALFDVAERRRRDGSIGRHAGALQRVAFSPDGKFLATAAVDEEVQIWNLAENKAAFVFPKTRHLSGIAFHPFEPLLVVAADRVNFWNTQTGRETKPLRDAPEDKTTRVAFSPDGNWVAFGMIDGSVALHSLKDGSSHRFRVHSGFVSRVCFSPDSRLLASGERDNRIALYDVRQHHVINSFEAHTDQIWGLAFAPDGKTLVSTSSDGTVKFWRVADQQLALTLTHDSGAVMDVAFSPVGDLMATCGMDKTLRFWPAPSLHEIDASLR